jgi:hypothetical protein
MFSGASSGPLFAEPISVTDLKGRTIEIELVSQGGDSVTFNRAGKEFILPLSNFDKSSQAKIRENAAKSPATTPKIQPDVVVGKRRQKANSYYMVNQEITCTIKLLNLNLKDPVPPLKGKILMIGQDRKHPNFFEVISSQALEVSIKPGETFVQEMAPFTTSYDSDNKGVGNSGGAQYVGYVLVLLNEAGEIILEHTVTGSFRKALEENRALAKQLVEYSKETTLTEKLVPAPHERGR